jgi:DNA-binding CsgD family transcriptional regulator
MISFSDYVSLVDERDPNLMIEHASKSFLGLTSFLGIIVIASTADHSTRQVLFADGYPDDCVEHVRAGFTKNEPYYRRFAANPVPLDWEQTGFRTSHEATKWLIPAGYLNGSSVSIRTSSGSELGSIHVNTRQESIGSQQRDAVNAFRNFVSRSLTLKSNRESLALTDREYTIVRYIAEGASNPEIAEILFVSRRTVATHVEHILNKLQVGNRVEIAVAAIRLGLV